MSTVLNKKSTLLFEVLTKFGISEKNMKNPISCEALAKFGVSEKKV